MIKTKHKYIDKVKVRKDDTSLILGTIHPHRTTYFQIDFFYGNTKLFWKILSESLNLDLSSKEKIITFLNLNNIWISDIIKECERETEKVTQEKKLKNISLNTTQISDSLINSEIKTIFLRVDLIKIMLQNYFVKITTLNITLKTLELIKIESFLYQKISLGGK